MEMFFILAGLFVFMTMLFVVFAVFFPEWVGITGKKAREVQKEHQETEPKKSKLS